MMIDVVECEWCITDRSGIKRLVWVREGRPLSTDGTACKTGDTRIVRIREGW